MQVQPWASQIHFMMSGFQDYIIQIFSNEHRVISYMYMARTVVTGVSKLSCTGCRRVLLGRYPGGRRLKWNYFLFTPSDMLLSKLIHNLTRLLAKLKCFHEI